MEVDWTQYTATELEKQMSPSRWNPNKTSEEVIQDYIDKSIAGKQ